MPFLGDIDSDGEMINLTVLERQMSKGKAICDKYALGGYTIDSCCESEGIDYHTFNNWFKSNSELSIMYKLAQKRHDDTYKRSLKLKCATALEKLVNGFSVEEVHQTGKPVFDKAGNQIGVQGIQVKKIKKHFAPNVTAVIFALKSIDPDTYKDNIPPIQAEEQIFKIGDQEIKF